MIIQGDGGGPLVACGMDGNCGTIPGQNYDLIGIHIEIILTSIVAIIITGAPTSSPSRSSCTPRKNYI